MIRTDSMWLVYKDEQGNEHFQNWQDLTDVGTLIDPETGEDMDLVGWVSDLSQEPASLSY